MDTEWAMTELEKFLAMTALSRPPSSPGVINVSPRRYTAGKDEDIISSAHVVEQILDRLLPNWKTEVDASKNKSVNRWVQHREAAKRAITALARQSEIDEKLGDNAPRMSAGNLHPWIWEGARSLWQSGHYRDAVRTACVKLNAEAQNKSGRTDISETDLFNQLFSIDPPKNGHPRLRVMPDDGSKTFSSYHRGVRSFAEGCYAAIRNPISHTEGSLSESEALEQLAALSVLARWVDGSTIETL